MKAQYSWLHATFFLSALGLLSCDTDSMCGEIKTSDVRVEWTGSYALDGCGFFVYINDVQHKAVNEDVLNHYSDRSLTMQYCSLGLITTACGEGWEFEIEGIKIFQILD